MFKFKIIFVALFVAWPTLVACYLATSTARPSSIDELGEELSDRDLFSRGVTEQNRNKALSSLFDGHLTREEAKLTLTLALDMLNHRPDKIPRRELSYDQEAKQLLQILTGEKRIGPATIEEHTPSPKRPDPLFDDSCEIDEGDSHRKVTSSTQRSIVDMASRGVSETIIRAKYPWYRRYYLQKFIDCLEGSQQVKRVLQFSTPAPHVLPEPPANLTPIVIGPDSTTIQFEPGFDGNAAIEKWIAEGQMAPVGDYKPRWQPVNISASHSNNNTVVISNLHPFSKYKIRLTPVNDVGPSRYPSEASPEFVTKPKEPEHAPKDLTVEDIETRSATARWSPLNNSEWLGIPRGYNLTWAETNGTYSNSHFINNTRADSMHIKDLEEFTEYKFVIYAVNDVGSSPSSEPFTIMTLEDVPTSGPANLTAKALNSTAISLGWDSVPSRHRNGIIRGYKIQYQVAKQNSSVHYKSVEDDVTRQVILNDLKPFTLYQFEVSAFTSVGDGVASSNVSFQTLEDAPGLPQNVSSPTVSLNSAKLFWDPPDNANGDIMGYRVSYHAITDGINNKEIASHELHQNERTFVAGNLKPNTHYIFSVAAKTKAGWGQQASTLIYTSNSESRGNSFYREWWFVIMIACLTVVIKVIITAWLYIQTKNYRYKQEATRSTSQDRLGDAGFTIDEDPAGHYNNGFGLSSNNAQHRRSNGTISQSTANLTLPKTPPRPQPGTVVDSDEGDDDVFEDNVNRRTSNYDSSCDSVTEKPRDNSSSPGQESESADDEYVNMANRHFVNHYANVNGTLRSQRSWKRNGQTSSTAINTKHTTTNQSTTPRLPQKQPPSIPQVPQVDQVTEQLDLLNNNHAVTLNGGRIIVDNMAGSRAPLPGFTSFNYGI